MAAALLAMPLSACSTLDSAWSSLAGGEGDDSSSADTSSKEHGRVVAISPSAAETAGPVGANGGAAGLNPNVDKSGGGPQQAKTTKGLPPGWGTNDPIVNARPLVVVRFDRPDVKYQQAVSYAAGAAMKRKADVAFDVLAISPTTGTPEEVAKARFASKEDAEGVIRTMVEAGVPIERVTLIVGYSSDEARSPEVHVFVR